jgi:hypothetical protein
VADIPPELLLQEINTRVRVILKNKSSFFITLIGLVRQKGKTFLRMYKTVGYGLKK